MGDLKSIKLSDDALNELNSGSGQSSKKTVEQITLESSPRPKKSESEKAGKAEKSEKNAPAPPVADKKTAAPSGGDPEMEDVTEEILKATDELNTAVGVVVDKAEVADQECERLRGELKTLADTVTAAIANVEKVLDGIDLKAELDDLKKRHQHLATLVEEVGAAEAMAQPNVDPDLPSWLKADMSNQDDPTTQMHVADVHDNTETVTDFPKNLGQEASNEDGAQSAAADGKKSVKLPQPPEVDQCKARLNRLLSTLEKLRDYPLMPGSEDERLDIQLVVALYDRCLSVLEEFLEAHDEIKAKARAKFDELSPEEQEKAEASQVWDEEMLTIYQTYRVTLVIDRVFDFVEEQIIEFSAYDYYKLIDYLSDIMKLERVPVADNAAFDPELHEFGGDGAKGNVVVRVLRSAYHDKLHDIQVRKATVQAGEGEPAAAESSAAPAVAPEDLGEVPVPDQVERCRKRVFGFKLALIKLLNMKAQELKEPLHADVKSLIQQKSTQLHMKFLKMHNEYKVQAQSNYETMMAADPSIEDSSVFWGEEILSNYENFCKLDFVEWFLDDVEKTIAKLKVEENRKVLDMVALEMEMARMNVVPGETEFDPEKHENAGKDSGSGGQEVFKKTIVGVKRSGYVDLNTNKVIRKPLVVCKIDTGFGELV